MTIEFSAEGDVCRETTHVQGVRSETHAVRGKYEIEGDRLIDSTMDGEASTLRIDDRGHLIMEVPDGSVYDFVRIDNQDTRKKSKDDAEDLQSDLQQ
jgi:hypothetical protein